MNIAVQSFRRTISPFRLGPTMASSRCLSSATATVLPRDSNQALGIAQYAIDFLSGKYGDNIEKSVYDKVRLFHADSVMCGISALALRTNAPTVLRNEAFDYPNEKGARVFGSLQRCHPEKAIVANCAAVREWDSNGTVFGYNRHLKAHQAGEFGHNDFYPVVIAAIQAMACHTNSSSGDDLDGRKALRAMICLDEIRGRLAEVFSLKTYRIDHVLYGAIASAAVYGALTGASAEMIESAIGMVVSHYTPWRSIRAGKQLSDSKGSSAALSTEAAILSIKRAMKGFLGPRDIFRNPDSPFRWNVKTGGDSPFDLILSHSGDDFAVSHMHFKLGLYEHQSAGAIEGILRLLMKNPEIYTSPAAREDIKEIVVKAYEPAFSIIGDPAKRDPHTRQSADHSMVYIVSTLLRKAIERREPLPNDLNEVWSHLMLTPYDYSHQSIFNELTRKLMEKTSFEHGGEEYDEKYPEGVPTSVTIEMANGRIYDSGFIMFPTGHASNAEANLEKILNEKFRLMADIAISDKEEAEEFLKKLKNMESLTNEDLQTLYYIKSLQFHEPIDQ